MPLVNYCRKCKTETPIGETCPHCGGKLTKIGEQVSFGVVRRPVKDWFAWNQVLRIGLPVLILVLIIAVTVEAIAGGSEGVNDLFSQGFFWTLLGVLGVMLLFILVLLYIQGVERVHYLFDKQGIWARTYLPDPSDLQLYSRFLTSQSIALLEDDQRPKLEGLTLIRRIYIPWQEIRRVRIWHQGFTILLFKPTFWQALAVSCPIGEMTEAEEYIRKKMKKFKKVKVQPIDKPIKKK